MSVVAERRPSELATSVLRHVAIRLFADARWPTAGDDLTMATVPQNATAPRSTRRLSSLPRETWASLAIAVMWLAVLADAVWGPDFVSTSGSGATTTTIPSAIFVALFAYLGTRIVARYGFSRDRGTED
jgi:hypothetical protein